MASIFRVSATAIGRFIYAHMGDTARAHDSTVFKSTSLYHSLPARLDDSEFLLANKAYELDKHVITPFREDAGHREFNETLSNKRVEVNRAFGVLKGRWRSLKILPVLIGCDQEKCHIRVIRWTFACIALHHLGQSLANRCSTIVNLACAVIRLMREMRASHG